MEKGGLLLSGRYTSKITSEAFPFILFLKQVQLSMLLSWQARDCCQFDGDDDKEEESGCRS